ncbi:MAG: cardiolipin synthase [Planctomycetia bacterium]|nr:cardiolipin synthase [Planctomycetia bacterium]MCC7314625.1 cardiolipin synthase [Planctomycetota bacterium]
MNAAAWTILSILHYSATIVVIENLLRKKHDPRGTLAWIFALLLLPFFSLALYLLIGNVPIQRKVRRRHHHRRMIEPNLRRKTTEAVASHDARDEPGLDPAQRSLIRMAVRIGESIVTRGNDVSIHHDAEAVFLSMSLALEAAQSHIHMQYYIFANDETGRAVGDLLMKKAREGLEVRLLLDAMGSWRLPRSYVRTLRRSGVKVAFFLPWGLISRRFHLNCRNHRKAVIIDGRIGFCGSQNIGDEYLGRRRRFGPWRDTHLRIRGPAVAQLQEVFIEDWHFAAHEDLSASDRYFPEPQLPGSQMVQIIASGPDRRPNMLHQLLNAAVSDADHFVSLVTPYFVPDRAMILALASAAFRGVRVRLMLPARSDHRIVLWAARSYYEELLESGVEIYEYSEGMLHAKTVVVDRRWAMVGSANMDERSFRINFELTSLLYDAGLAQDLHADFDALRERAVRITPEYLQKWTYLQNLTMGAARLATPLL